MDIQTTTSRLRHTFAYPTDSSSSRSSPEPALDEQEQDNLIASLASQNESSNARFRLLLLALPALSTLPYLIALFTAPSSSGRLIAILALTSLVSTAWLLWSLPPGLTGIERLDRWASGRVDKGKKPVRQRQSLADMIRRRRNMGKSTTSILDAGERGKSPLEAYLPFLNLGLCGVLVLTGFVRERGSWQVACLPAVVYGVVIAAKMVMGGVDPERELAGLKYEYKGA